MSYYVQAVPAESAKLLASGGSFLFHFSLGAWVHGSVPYDGTSFYLSIGLPGGSGATHAAAYSAVLTAPNGAISLSVASSGASSNVFYILDPADFTAGGVSTLLITNTYSGPNSQDSTIFDPSTYALFDPAAQGGAPSPVPGCTNPAAINYNPSSTVDNGSCILPVRGCTIPGSLNYNRSANVNDGSCIPIIPGCTVPGAINYNPLANKDDGSGVFFFAYPDGPPPPDLCVWAGDLLPACAWTWSDSFAAPAITAAQIAALTTFIYGIGNEPFGLGNEPLGAPPLMAGYPLFSLGNPPLTLGTPPGATGTPGAGMPTPQASIFDILSAQYTAIADLRSQLMAFVNNSPSGIEPIIPITATTTGTMPNVNTVYKVTPASNTVFTLPLATGVGRRLYFDLATLGSFTFALALSGTDIYEGGASPTSLYTSGSSFAVRDIAAGVWAIE